MKPAILPLNQRGAVLFIAIIMLLSLSIIGVYAADAGIAFALTTVTFGNIDSVNPAEEDIDTSATGLHISSLDVYYLCNTPPPVGSGTGLRGFRAHYHRIDSAGNDPGNNASTAVQAEGYRIGF